MIHLDQARAWYPDDDPTHGFAHVLRVYGLGEYITQQEGARWDIVRSAVLLHDAQGDTDRGGHHLAAALFAKQVLEKEGWPSEDISAVQHCIRAHRFRDPGEVPQTLEAKVLFDADKLDAIGAVGTMRAIAYAVHNGQDLYHSPSKRFLETGQKEPGEPHTPAHEYHFKLRHLSAKMYTDTGQRLAEERHQIMVQFFQHLDQELRGVS
ncbi:MAG: HD domain-containing protein [Anaerolineales bacterium]|nr:HD domain-containing protein [Anaerolineales bacterium]MBS3753459.1 HD domain-containing protein [Anaerolineales bacterium]